MEGIGIDDQRYRQGSFGGNPGQQHDARRPMPQAGPSSHALPQSSAAPPGPWPPQHQVSGPPPPSVVSYDRPQSAQAYPHPQAYGPYPPPPRGDYGAPASAPPYSRSAESLSTPRRSPVDAGNPGHLQPVNGHAPEGPPGEYYAAGDYRGRPNYPSTEASPSGKQPHPLQIPGGSREGMQNPPSGPPPAPLSGPSQHPPGPYSAHPPPPHPASAGPGNRISPVGYEAQPYWGVPMNSQSAFPPRPRGHRAQHACENCRTRKAKCDEGKPSCGHCTENNLTCHYRDLQPQKQEKAGQAQLEILNSIHQTVQGLSDTMSDMASLVQLHEKELEKLRNQQHPTEGPSQHSSTQHAAMQRTFSASIDSPVVKTESKSFAENAEAVPPSQTGIRSYGGGLIAAMDHTTAAHELLSWPSIKLLLKDRMPEKDYVQQGEWVRGLLRLYGHGEGANKDDTARAPASPAASAISSNSDEQVGGSPDFAWGFDFENPGDGPIPEDHPGGLTAEAKLKLDPELIDEYVKSYIENMYILHPFLDPRRLRTMIAKFKQLYSPQRLSSLGKRKRGEEPRHKFQVDNTFIQSGEREYLPPKYSKPERNSGNAIILLILALGKICAHKTPLPGPARGHGPQSGATSTPSSQPTFRSSSAMSSMQNSPSLPQATPGQGHPSVTDDQASGARNLDVIPGLAYYSWAVGVLGEHVGGSDLEHCQAFLLAALYAGQLAHPYTSYGWIAQASQACIGLFKRHSNNMISTNSGAQKDRASRERILVDLIETCYWTCLQLESDIRAELNQLQPSGIAEHEAWMDENQLFPTTHAIDATGTPYDQNMISQYYLFQIYLRKELNKVHSEFYNPKNKHNITVDLVQSWFDGIEAYRQIFRGVYNWRDEDEPANDILAARLRAKFYGGRNIIIRPLLESIIKDELEAANNHSQMKGHDFASPATIANTTQSRSPAGPHARTSVGFPRQQYEHKFPAHFQLSLGLRHVEIPPLKPEERNLAQIGINSLIHSTIAFDNVPGGRLIVTNIFGTYHAQFGNMLILAAAYQSPRLREFVDRERLEYLLLRTIRVLFDHKEISPTLNHDASILELIRRNLPSSIEPTESFSSHDT